MKVAAYQAPLLRSGSLPTNNGLPPEKTRAGLVTHARNVDIARAIENSVWVIRADVAGYTAELKSDGASGIVDPDGMVLQPAERSTEDLLVAELDTSPRERRRMPQETAL